MEDLIGLLVVGAFAAITMIAKVAEKRKAEQQRKQQQGQRTLRREDLPEATRRMLYGDGAGPRTATPRVGDPRVAQPRAADPRTVRPATPGPVASPPRQDAQPTPEMRRLREQQMARERGSVAPQPQAPAQRRPRQTVEPRVATPQSLQEAYRQTHPRPGQPPVQPRQPRQPRARQQQKAAPACPRRGSERAWLFSTPKTVRHGIIMMEILGKPKGLQDF